MIVAKCQQPLLTAKASFADCNGKTSHGLKSWLCLYMSVMGYQHGLGSSFNFQVPRIFKTKGQFLVL